MNHTLPSPPKPRAPEAEMVWVIVPFSRPENLNLILSNFNRQAFPYKKLVLVENGDAVGAAHSLQSSALVLMSERHQSIAKNLALSEIRKRGGGFTAIMDDDDWYGPGYLSELVGYARTHDIVGKARNFISVDGKMWLCGREQAMNKAGWLTGGTIACWAENCPEYPMKKVGEDVGFCDRAHSLGMSLFATSVYHYLYRRNTGGRHAWNVTHQKLRLQSSAMRSLDLGDEDLDVVCGNKLDVNVKALAAYATGEKHVTA